MSTLHCWMTSLAAMGNVTRADAASGAAVFWNWSMDGRGCAVQSAKTKLQDARVGGIAK